MGRSDWANVSLEEASCPSTSAARWATLHEDPASRQVQHTPALGPPMTSRPGVCTNAPARTGRRALVADPVVGAILVDSPRLPAQVRCRATTRRRRRWLEKQVLGRKNRRGKFWRGPLDPPDHPRTKNIAIKKSSLIAPSRHPRSRTCRTYPNPTGRKPLNLTRPPLSPDAGASASVAGGHATAVRGRGSRLPAGPAPVARGRRRRGGPGVVSRWVPRDFCCSGGLGVPRGECRTAWDALRTSFSDPRFFSGV